MRRQPMSVWLWEYVEVNHGPQHSNKDYGFLLATFGMHQLHNCTLHLMFQEWHLFFNGLFYIILGVERKELLMRFVLLVCQEPSLGGLDST